MSGRCRQRRAGAEPAEAPGRELTVPSRPAPRRGARRAGRRRAAGGRGSALKMAAAVASPTAQAVLCAAASPAAAAASTTQGRHHRCCHPVRLMRSLPSGGTTPRRAQDCCRRTRWVAKVGAEVGGRLVGAALHHERRSIPEAVIRTVPSTASLDPDVRTAGSSRPAVRWDAWKAISFR
ncbi:hypothetical protein GCM10007977_025330 [Dactylosporangium sucinum]|uniref:Uncharacterized protein n=1 Tax=Dactylosporangium sucinum TaxID=1424081 RepID=A0A917TH69_9ACTN|nr:hypothetical protein GCM10007977_025330 [Dactylosporangium sucinum]